MGPRSWPASPGAAPQGRCSRLGWFVEGRHFVPETGLAAADARMSRLDRPAGAVIEFDQGAVVVGVRSLAAHFIEAPSLGGFRRVEGLDEFTGFKMTATRT